VVTALVTAPDALASAYAHCTRLAREHYENFPVASLLLPAPMRPHIAAIYAFARRADDFADEPGPAPAERLALLKDWHRRLHDPRPTGTTGDDLIFTALHHTIAARELPVGLFDDLLSAFMQDVGTTRYRTWDEVMDYCRRSADPVGRLVLRVAGYRSPALDAASDAVCSALQLANFWQDFGRDWSHGRLYVPLEERDRHGARDQDLDAGRMTPEWKRAIEAAVARTRELFRRGRPVCDGTRGRLRWELRLTWLGGTRILEKIEANGFDVLGRRPTIGAADAPLLIARAIVWGRSRVDLVASG
jgi:squalene synthase HpnC